MNAPTRAEFLERRRSGIGGTDVSVILGLNPYKTPFELWLDKTGRSLDEKLDPDRDERMHFGNVLEDVVARETAEREGFKVQRINEQLVSAKWHRAVANIDRAIIAPGTRARWDAAAGRVLGADGILECKTASAYALNGDGWGEAGTDEVPQHYWLQVQWYLGVSRIDAGVLSCLFGGQKLKIYRIQREEEVFDDLLETANNWWRRHIDADTPPEPTTEAEARIAFRRHQPGVEQIVDATLAGAVEELREINGTIKALEADAQELRDRITSAFGEAEAISYQGRKLATWKANKPSARTDWAAVAKAVCTPPEVINQFTTTHEGARVLRLLSTKE